jgi:hypothetical protein
MKEFGLLGLYRKVNFYVSLCKVDKGDAYIKVGVCCDHWNWN